MSRSREVRPGETLEWLHEAVEQYLGKTLYLPGGHAGRMIVAMAREYLRYRAAGVVPARLVKCDSIDSGVGCSTCVPDCEWLEEVRDDR